MDRGQTKMMKKKLTISDVLDTDALINEKHRELIHIVDCIFEINEECFNDVFSKIKSYKDDLSYLYNCIEYAKLVRPKQRKCLLQLRSLLTKNLGNKVNKDEIDSLGNNINIFSEASIEFVIKEDDIENFIKLANEPSFDPKGKAQTRKELFIHIIDDSFNDNNLTYIQLMAYFGSVKCFKYALIDGTYDVSNLAKYAIAGGNKEIINLLVQNNISFDSCFGVASMYHRNDICNWLLLNYQNEIIAPKKSLKYFNDRIFIFMQKNGFGLSKDELIDVLYYLSEVGNLNIIKYIVEEMKKSIRPDSLVSFEMLKRASKFNHLKIVQYLINEINVKANSFALLKACKKGNLEIVKFLSELLDNKKLLSALTYSCLIGKVEIVKYFIENSKLDIEYIQNCDPLHCAVESGNIELVKYLSKVNGINVNNVTQCKDADNQKMHKYEPNQGIVPLHIAVINKNMEITKYLIEECKADVNAADYYGRNALHFATNNDDLEMIKYLIMECGLNPNLPDKKGESALYIANKHCNLEVLKFLVDECHANTKDISINAIK